MCPDCFESVWCAVLMWEFWCVTRKSRPPTSGSNSIRNLSSSVQLRQRSSRWLDCYWRIHQSQSATLHSLGHWWYRKEHGHFAQYNELCQWDIKMITGVLHHWRLMCLSLESSCCFWRPSYVSSRRGRPDHLRVCPHFPLCGEGYLVQRCSAVSRT